MPNLVRIQPHLYLYTPLGVAEAHWIVCSDNLEVSVNYGCFMCETKEHWWWPNPQVRLCESITAIRSSKHSPIFIANDLFETLKPHILRHKESPFYQRAANV